MPQSFFGKQLATCPIDQCRRYTLGNCPVDIRLRDVVEAVVDLLKDGFARDKSSALEEKEMKYPDVNFLSLVQEKLSISKDEFMLCAICHERFLCPVTMRCGHTFCRHCLQRQFDSEAKCPQCQAKAKWPFKAGLADHHDPLKDWTFNHHLASIISTCWRPWVLDRAKEVFDEDTLIPPDMDIPLFVCTTSYPTQPTYLRIFEPRYRRFLRRVMNSTSQTFGMVDSRPGPDENVTIPGFNFSRSGTIIRVDRLKHTEDRDILIRTIGISRFEVKDAHKWDGYWAATIKAIDDCVDEVVKPRTPTEDANLISLGYNPNDITLKGISRVSLHDTNLPTLFTDAELMALIREYLELRLQNADPERWEVSLANIGPPPDDDIATYVWWFARFVHLRGEIGLRLLKSTSVRQRLQILVLYALQNVPSDVFDEWSAAQVTAL